MRRRHSFALLLCNIMLIGGIALAAPLRAEEANEYIQGEVVVKLASASDLHDVAVEYGLDPVPIDQFGSRPIYQMRIVDGASPQERAKALVADGQKRVEYAEPNYTGQTPEGRHNVSWAKGEAASYASQWAPTAMRLAEAHQVSRGAGVTVAVLDTGVDAAHPDLARRLAGGYDFIDGDANPAEEGSHEQNAAYGHGTHVAGLVALAAPDAQIMPVRVLDPDGLGNLWVMAEALAYAANPDGDATTDDGADVINLSWGTPESVELLKEVLQDVIGVGGDADEGGGGGQGIVVLAAAGNSGDSKPQYPAAEDEMEILAVGASTAEDTLATFSTYGNWVRIAAPGEAIVSGVPGGGYGTWSGTSMATPLAAGTAALVRSAYPDLGVVEVIDRIESSAAKIDGAVPLRVDAAAALGLN
ncbi:MAG TPA: S8 family serine peptidase [Herpetosiphonaceae bacterium]|nr:S8 family serine peptidase [Herpetosiphonaceae bacterium]